MKYAMGGTTMLKLGPSNATTTTTTSLNTATKVATSPPPLQWWLWREGSWAQDMSQAPGMYFFLFFSFFFFYCTNISKCTHLHKCGTIWTTNCSKGRKMGPNDASSVVWALGEFFFPHSLCIFCYQLMFYCM